ncbi:hypothetical protein SAMN00120144_3249 [Hymenobacter roseosalivarius DSM 11622]|uniref:Uncharacterized protein n=1 Tax=Hymenobacter roseosalivarius DSM 11622 TaxID=645990 RepID=A0A1W1W4B4_9BACT|nr:RagB/SusD family nutrient uptake outer membrane protein [Hymenobacter roseosalivarius]SMC00436.1 hypothetical protein SAMN00120144_3249 [Hymenobacter roseosalivarius DSM 11622]
MKSIKTRLTLLVLGGLLLTAPACDLNLPNPNSPPESQVLTTRDGLLALSVGMRQFYGNSALEPIILSTGTTALELRGVSTFTNVLEIEAGGAALPNNNANVLALWSRLLRVAGMAEDLIANAPTVFSADPATRDAVLAHAYLFRAIALGTLAQYFEQAPLTTSPVGSPAATFVPREQLQAEAIRLLDAAQQLITATPPSANFTTQVLGTSFNLGNTINAYRVRYNLQVSNYAATLAAAALVNLSSTSTFQFNTQNPNPIFQSAVIAKNFRPRELTGFGLPAALAEPNDARVRFYIAEERIGTNTLPLVAGFFRAIDAPIPAYLPDEIRLSRAEALVRSGGSLTAALQDINAVRTQAPAADPFGVGGNLPAYGGAVTADALLLEIYRQRSAELYMTGLRLPDSRRFGRPGPGQPNAERTRNFYPYPQQERLTNPNVPEDPAI